MQGKGGAEWGTVALTGYFLSPESLEVEMRIQMVGNVSRYGAHKCEPHHLEQYEHQRCHSSSSKISALFP